MLGAPAPLGAALSFSIGPLLVDSGNYSCFAFFHAIASLIVLLLACAADCGTAYEARAAVAARIGTYDRAQWRALLRRAPCLDSLALAFTLVYGYFGLWGAALWPN